MEKLHPFILVNGSLFCASVNLNEPFLTQLVEITIVRRSGGRGKGKGKGKGGGKVKGGVAYCLQRKVVVGGGWWVVVWRGLPRGS